MTTETLLTDAEIITIGQQARAIEQGENGYILPVTYARAIEQAVLQSPEIQSAKLMAECMDMVRQELIEAGVIDATVPPMMVANAVLAEMQALRKDSERYKRALERISKWGRPWTQDDLYGRNWRGCAAEALYGGFDAAMEQQR